MQWETKKASCKIKHIILIILLIIHYSPLSNNLSFDLEAQFIKYDKSK